MSRQAKIIIFGLILGYSIYSHQNNSSIFDWAKETRESNIKESEERRKRLREQEKQRETRKINEEKIENNFKTEIEYYAQPKNGFSPYNAFFGKGIYNNASGNVFVIKNSNSTDAIVLLVNAYSGKKVRNEYIRKGATFEMTGVPNGTYYLEWASGNNWSPNLKVGKLRGGFQTDASFTKTRESSDWMKVNGYQQWTVTLYTVKGGDVQSESLSASEFGN